MIRLFLMLLGAEVVRRRWAVIGGAGLLWSCLGLLIFLDALDGSLLFPVQWLGYALLFEGAMSLLAGSAGHGAARGLRWAKGLGLGLVGILTIETTGTGGILLALLIGIAFALDGVLKVAAARIIRFRGWRVSQALGVLSLAMAVATLQPWPTWYVGTIGCNVGIALFLSGIMAMVMARRLRRLPPGASLSDLVQARRRAPAMPPERVAPGQDLVVRVWTPTGGAGPPPPGAAAHRHVVDRYIAAVDATGTISTGHAALECAPDLYISHYPALELDRSPDNFRAALRATEENDVPGLFKPSYPEEVAGWCEATMQVRFSDFDAARLHAFWAAYRTDDTYNLTSRNCSSAVAAALDAALEGALGARLASPGSLLLLGRAVLSPELWAATLLRKRAESMSWTPGLVLDYARAISAVVNPPATGWLELARRARQRTRVKRPVPANARRSSRTG